MRPRPFLISFLIGGLVFGVVYYALRDDPCIETTDFHMEPNVVSPGQKFRAVWTDKVLRDCDGTLNRRFLDTEGIDIWVFLPAHTVHHGPPGSVNRFHTPWTAPEDAHPGMKLVFRKDVKRWGNFFQRWVRPMEEAQEAPFSIGESAQELRRP